ncbi:MAG: hypothetical protein ACAH22_00020, partial [Tardiphaga sp.]
MGPLAPVPTRAALARSRSMGAKLGREFSDARQRHGVAAGYLGSIEHTITSPLADRRARDAEHRRRVGDENYSCVGLGLAHRSPPPTTLLS